MALISLRDITLSYGGPPLLDGLTIQIQAGEKICLLGRNGAGKSTLMHIINGTTEPDSGEVIRDRNLKTALLSQEIPSGMSGTIYDTIAGGITHIEDINHHPDAVEERKHRGQVEKTLSLLSLDPGLRCETLSAGMKRRVLLGRALVNEPDILLLDEPTNHLDIGAIQWLEDFIGRYGKTVFFVTHDRVFVQKIATRIIELDRGRLADWRCDYATFLQRKDALLDAEEQQNANFDKKLAQEEVWIRRGIKARRTRNEGRVRALQEMRRKRAERRELQGSVSMGINQAERSGKIVIEAENISFSYGGADIVRGFSTGIQRGDRVGILGPNGCGKSTLIRLLLMELEPSRGTVRQGTRLETAYFDQLKDTLRNDLTVRQNIAEAGEYIEFNGRKKHVIGYLQDFLFTPDRAAQRVEVLSGGEKNRLMLAKLLTRPANLLILDEPTNDLDLETVELLEELLMEFEGTLILVSHDRAFLNNVVTSTIVFEGDGRLTEYAGGYDDWLRQKKEPPPIRQQKTPPAKKAPDPGRAKKMSFREIKELEGLPGLLEAKENRRAELQNLMADPALYREKGGSVSAVRREFLELERELETLYLRWDELEAKKAGE